MVTGSDVRTAQSVRVISEAIGARSRWWWWTRDARYICIENTAILRISVLHCVSKNFTLFIFMISLANVIRFCQVLAQKYPHGIWNKAHMHRPSHLTSPTECRLLCWNRLCCSPQQYRFVKHRNLAAIDETKLAHHQNETVRDETKFPDSAQPYGDYSASWGDWLAWRSAVYI